MSKSNPWKDAMEAMDEFQSFASTITGMKKTLTDQGWTDRGAEAILLQLLVNSAAQQVKP